MNYQTTAQQHEGETRLLACAHCRAAMDAISVDDVLSSAKHHLKRVAA